MSFIERYAKEKKKEFWDEDNDPDGGHHSKLSPKQKAKAKARAKAHGRPYPNKVDNTWAAREAGVYPNNRDWSEHEQNIRDLMNETERGQSWHLDHNEPEAADEHAQLKHHLLNALDLINRIR